MINSSISGVDTRIKEFKTVNGAASFQAAFVASKGSSDPYGMSLASINQCSDSPNSGVNRWLCLQWSNSAGTYGVQMAMSFYIDQIYIRRMVNSSWSAWATIAAFSGCYSDLNFVTTSSAQDTPDITWYYSNGQEKMRLYAPNEPTAKVGPYFRIFKKDGTQLYNGSLALV